MRTLALGLFLALSASTLANAAERLVEAPYPANPPWKLVTNQSAGAAWLREQIPANQQIETYKDILASQAFPQQRGTDPAAFLQGMFQRIGGQCSGVRVNGPTEAVEGGYTVAYAQIYCGRQNGETYGVDMFFKVVAGDEALYVVNRDMRVPPSDVGGVQDFGKDGMAAANASMKAAAVANTYLTKSIYLCGAGSTDKRCR
jgi:hypothetical protein